MTEKRLNNYLKQAKMMVQGLHSNDSQQNLEGNFSSENIRKLSSSQKKLFMSVDYKNSGLYSSQNSSDILFSALNHGEQSDGGSQ